MNRSGMMRLSLSALVSYAEGLAAKLNAQADALERKNDRRRGRRRLSRAKAARRERERRHRQQIDAIRATQAQLKDAQDVIAEKSQAAQAQAELLFAARSSVAAAADLSKPKRQPDLAAAVELATSPDPRFHAFVPLTDELIADPEMCAIYVRAKVTEKISGVIDELFEAAEKALAIHEDAGCSCEGCAALREAIAQATVRR